MEGGADAIAADELCVECRADPPEAPVDERDEAAAEEVLLSEKHSWKIALAIMKAVRSSVVSNIGIGFEGPCNVSSSATKDVKSCFSKRAKG